MCANTTYDRAKAVADEIAELPHVTGVTFDDSTAHFVSSAALLTVCCSSRTEYAFSDSSIDELVHSESRDAARSTS